MIKITRKTTIDQLKYYPYHQMWIESHTGTPIYNIYIYNIHQYIIYIYIYNIHQYIIYIYI